MFRPRSRYDLPVVTVLDVRTNTKTAFMIGTQPLVWQDGRTILVSGAPGKWWQVDVESREVRRIEWPGNWEGPIASLGSNLLLYRGLPTEGTEPRWRGASPIAVKRALGSLKIAEVDTGNFQTLLTYLDPRREVSFGVVGER